RYPQFTRDIQAAEFNTARWYFTKAILDNDFTQVKKLAPMMVRKYTSRLIVHGVQQGWRQAKRCLRTAKRVLGTSSARPKTRIASAPLPQPGTAFSDRFMTMPAKEAIGLTSSRMVNNE
ncbi:glycosyltransferase family 2 protein, partial [Rhizobium ruizarguesonis]